MGTPDSRKSSPLSGVRVVELCNVAAGPFCGMLLSDLGADVIKVEPPDGDMLRQWPPHTNGYSENFASLNRGKKSICLDLKQEPDRRIAHDLIRIADVVIENNRPGAMARLGLDYPVFASERPSLIYCSISAYGQSGPRASEGGFDVTIQAMSGIMSVTGEPGGPPAKCGVPVADFAAGLYGAFAVSAMLARVRAGGEGGHIDVPMMGTSLAIAALQTSEFFGTGRDPRPLGSAHPRNAPYQAFPARDGYFVLAAGNDKLWHAVCDTIGRQDLKNDPRFDSSSRRASNQAVLADILTEVFRTAGADDWLARLAEAGVPCSPIHTYSQALADRQTEAAGWVLPMELPGGGETRTFGPPLKIDATAPPVVTRPPMLDENREEILALLRG
jgi:formyl-CoA transferase